MRRSSAVLMVGVMMASPWLAGCQGPQRKFVTYPPGTLAVPYETASGPTACLVASVSMAANYLVDKHEFAEPAVRAEMKAQGLQENSVADVKKYLEERGLYLVTLTGEADGRPPLGLGFWLERRGYPVICIINEHGADQKFNHAVVVTGISKNSADPPADIVYYLDPAAAEPLQSSELTQFEAAWELGKRAMMIVVAPPTESAPAAQ